MRNVHIFREERGSILVTTGLCMMLFVGILGFAIDFGHMLFVKRGLQSAADAAALAAALETRSCNGTSACSAMQTAAQQALQENGISASTILTGCSGTPGSGVTLTVNNPPCALSGDPNTGKTSYAEAVISEPVQTYFASVM